MSDDMNEGGNGSWSEWRIWIKETIKECRKDIKDLYDIYQQLERNTRNRNEVLEKTVTDITNKTKEIFKEELNQINVEVARLSTKINIYVGIAMGLLSGVGGIITYLIYIYVEGG